MFGIVVKIHEKKKVRVNYSTNPAIPKMDWFDMGFWNKKTYNIMKRKIIIIQFI
jgi:hypothetical protein